MLLFKTLITRSFYLTNTISLQSVSNFLSNVADNRQIDSQPNKQTNKQTNKSYRKHNLFGRDKNKIYQVMHLLDVKKYCLNHLPKEWRVLH